MDFDSFSTSNWKDVNEFDVGSVKIGKLQTLTPAGQNLMILGDKGIGIYNYNGVVEFQDNAEVNGASWNEKFCFIRNPTSITIYDLKDYKKIGSIPMDYATNKLFISEDGREIMTIGPGVNQNKLMKFYQF